jgi:hypothetical protein
MLRPRRPPSQEILRRQPTLSRRRFHRDHRRRSSRLDRRNGPDDDKRHVLAVGKCNNAPEAESLAYRLIGDEERGCARIRWEGPTDHKASDLLATRLELDDQDDTIDAASVLAEILDDGPVWVKEAIDRMATAGFSKDQAKRAKAKLHAYSLKVGKPGDLEQGWQWSLPTRRERQESEECSTPNLATLAPFVHSSGRVQNGHTP